MGTMVVLAYSGTDYIGVISKVAQLTPVVVPAYLLKNYLTTPKCQYDAYYRCAFIMSSVTGHTLGNSAQLPLFGLMVAIPYSMQDTQHHFLSLYFFDKARSFI